MATKKPVKKAAAKKAVAKKVSKKVADKKPSRKNPVRELKHYFVKITLTNNATGYLSDYTDKGPAVDTEISKALKSTDKKVMMALAFAVVKDKIRSIKSVEIVDKKSIIEKKNI